MWEAGSGGGDGMGKLEIKQAPELPKILCMQTKPVEKKNLSKLKNKNRGQ